MYMTSKRPLCQVEQFLDVNREYMVFFVCKKKHLCEFIVHYLTGPTKLHTQAICGKRHINYG